MKKRSAQHPLLRFLFIIYCGVMLWLLFGRSVCWDSSISYEQMLMRNINTTPFYTIKNYLRVIVDRTNDSVYIHCLINLLGNILLFIPIGILIPKLWKKLRNFFKFFFICLLMILAVELIQLFALLGSCDIDDVILNMTGLTAGYIIWSIFK